MRIAFVVSDSIDEAWGHRTHILEVWKGLRKRTETRMYIPRPRSFELAGPGIVTVPEIRIPILGVAFRQTALLCRLLLDAGRFRPDVVYARHSPLALAPLLAARCLRIPIVFELNCLMTEDLRINNAGAATIRLCEINEALLFRHVTGIVAVSDGIAHAVAGTHGRTDTVVIANGVDCDHFRPRDRAEALASLGLPSDCQYICFVGNLAPWQGVPCLIKAMARVVEAHPGARALIVGGGEEEEALREASRDYGVEGACIFTGSVPYADVPAYIAAATVCVAPFTRRRNERTGLSPLKLYEYMACARPVVCSAMPGVTEMVRESGAGVTVPPEDSDALASALIARLSDGPGNEVLGSNGRRYVSEGHCWAHVVDRIVAVLEDAADTDAG